MKPSQDEYASTCAVPTDEPPATLESVAAAVRDIEDRFGPLPKRPEPYTFRSAEFFIDGESIGTFDNVSWNYQPKTPPIAPRILMRETFEFSCSVTVPMKRRTWSRFVRSLSKPRRLYTPFETLMRRVTYGGRKGRRAARRLMAMSDSQWAAGLASH